MNTKKVTYSLVTFFSLSYVLCIAAGAVLPESMRMSAFLEAVLPGFAWLSGSAFFIGLAGAILWGVYIGVGFSWIYNRLSRPTS